MLGVVARDGYLGACRVEAIRHIESLLNDRERSHPAYRAVLDYPLREAKGLRPTLVIAACRSLGGGLAEAVPTAAVFELLHNAFLVHDDVEDGSELRRHAPTLATQLGLPLAVHTGDTMLAMALRPLLDNMESLDLGRALRILELVAEVMRRTAEGQALELTWIAESRWDISPAQYLEMVALKTAWYTFAGPLAAGAIIAEAQSSLVADMLQLGLDLGIAFQIRDDILNLAARTDVIGKESCGDLWEGKRTLILAHYFATAGPVEAVKVRAILDRTRGGTSDQVAALAGVFDGLSTQGIITTALRRSIEEAIRESQARSRKTPGDIAFVRAQLNDAIEHASADAEMYAGRAAARWSRVCNVIAPTFHRDVIESLIDFAIARSY